MKFEFINSHVLSTTQYPIVNFVKYTILYLLFFLLIPSPTHAAKFTLDDLTTLMTSNYIAEEIHFTENKNLRFLNKSLILHGRFYFRSSNFLQKNIDRPFIKVYTLKYNTITYTDKKLESVILTLKDHPLIYASMKAFYVTMTGNFHRLRAQYSIQLTGNANKWELILTPKSKRVLKYIKNLFLSGNHAFIERVITNERNGDNSTIWMKK